MATSTAVDPELNDETGSIGDPSLPLPDRDSDLSGSPVGSDLDLDISHISAPVPMEDPLSDEASLDHLFALSALAIPSTPITSSARPLIVEPAQPGSRNTFFFLDHTRRLAVTHYQRVPQPAIAAREAGPPFVLRVYIRSNISMFNTPDHLRTILGWCEQLLMLPATSHLLGELGLSGTSIRIEMFDGQDDLAAIMAHSRSESEHRHMCIEYLDCEKEMKLAKSLMDQGDIALDPALHPRIAIRLSRENQLQRDIRDFEASKRHPRAWTPPANARPLHQAQAPGSVPRQPLPAHTAQPIPRPSIAAPPRQSSYSPIPGPLSSPPPPTFHRPSPTPAPAAAPRMPKPGSPLSPYLRSHNPIAPASFFLAPTQPYHHAVVVVDELPWLSRGLVVLKFDKEKDWTEACDVGSLDEGDYVAERVSCFEDGRVEARAAERNVAEGMKAGRIGGVGQAVGEMMEMEIVSKRWLGEVLVETIKGGYFAHLGQ